MQQAPRQRGPGAMQRETEKGKIAMGCRAAREELKSRDRKLDKEQQRKKEKKTKPPCPTGQRGSD